MTKKEPIKKVADKDIKVYKILRVLPDGVITSPCELDYVWNKGTEHETNLDIPIPMFLYFKINHGFHSLVHRPEIEHLHLDVWRTATSYTLFSVDEYEEVLECIIPKGSIYYENEYGEIVSNKLKII